ncbi:hypothetical protein ACH4F6_38060 [Streptomyces sp. NPDC017936]|uniref:hypothetical protein n=1 Tax=Streptomyces sp. NPDC017936 TaxID=3365016 RepID=UPI00379ACA5F
MNDATARPLLAEAREAADTYLAGMLKDGRLTEEAAAGLATMGFTVTTRVLADMRTRDGLNPQAITGAWKRRLDQARREHDARGTVAAGYALAIWDGMQRDLAAFLRETEAEQR